LRDSLVSTFGDATPAPLLRALENWKLHWQHSLDHNQPAALRADHENARDKYHREICSLLKSLMDRDI